MGYKVKKIYVGTQQVRPLVPATSITLNKSSISLTTVGQTSQLTATLTPSGSTSTVSWSSSNTSIATVSSSGLVTCVTPGTCTITATTNNGLTATCGVTNGWNPGSNTVAYYPLTSSTNVNDISGNNRNLTNSGVTFGTYKGVDCAYFGGSQKMTNTSFVSNQQALTVSCYVYWIWNGQSSSGNYNQLIWRWGGSSANFGPYIDVLNSRKLVCSPGGIGTQYPVSDSGWKYVTVTFNGSNIVKLYVNGVLDATNSNASVPSGSYFVVGGWTQNSTSVWKGGISEVIVENKARTDAEILDYYNSTKSIYGL